MGPSPRTPEKFDLAAALRELDELELFFAQPLTDLEAGMQKHEQALKIAAAIGSYLTSMESRLEVLESNYS